MSTTFVAVYRGKTISGARLVGVSADPALVQEVCGRLLAEQGDRRPQDDPVLLRLEQGRSDALRAAIREVPA